MTPTLEMVFVAFFFGFGLGGFVFEYFASFEIRDLKAKVKHFEHALHMVRQGFVPSKMDVAAYRDRED